MTSFKEMLEESDGPQWTENEKRMLKYMLTHDGMQFMRYFFRFREGSKMLINWHHYVLEYVMQAIYDLKINRLIINMPPGYGKTEIAVLNFIARGFIINPRSRFLHASYSADLAHENSSKIKTTFESPPFQELWPMAVRNDSKGKKRWTTEYGGTMSAAAAGGQVTGFRAGRMNIDRFTGALVVDDPVKPKDAYSTPKRTAVNDGFNNTIRSRLAVEETPLIVVMQRIHEDDLCGFLLRGGSGDMWYHLTLPTLLSDEYFNKDYPKEYTHGIKLDINGLLKAIHTGVHYAF